MRDLSKVLDAKLEEIHKEITLNFTKEQGIGVHSGKSGLLLFPLSAI